MVNKKNLRVEYDNFLKTKKYEKNEKLKNNMQH